MGSQKEVEFDDWRVGKGLNPVFIVGQNPGTQRKGQQTNTVWFGNRSADLLWDVIDGLEPIYLTNVCNYQRMTRKRVQSGIKCLRDKIKQEQPRKIIALGEFAQAGVLAAKPDCPVVSYPHPSYIARFNRDKRAYREAIRKEIME